MYIINVWDINEKLYSQKTPHILPVRASYGVSIVSIFGDNWPNMWTTLCHTREPGVWTNGGHSIQCLNPNGPSQKSMELMTPRLINNETGHQPTLKWQLFNSHLLVIKWQLKKIGDAQKKYLNFKSNTLMMVSQINAGTMAGNNCLVPFQRILVHMNK